MSSERFTRESRLAPRRKGRFRVVVRHPHALPATCLSTDISFTGVFLEIPKSMRPVPGSILDISMMLDAGPVMHQMRCKATVMRTTDSGVGLRFNQLFSKDYDALLRCVFGAATSTPKDHAQRAVGL